MLGDHPIIFRRRQKIHMDNLKGLIGLRNLHHLDGPGIRTIANQRFNEITQSIGCNSGVSKNGPFSSSPHLCENAQLLSATWEE